MRASTTTGEETPADVLAAAVLVALAALAVLWALRARSPVRLTTGYQALLLSNGSV